MFKTHETNLGVPNIVELGFGAAKFTQQYGMNRSRPCVGCLVPYRMYKEVPNFVELGFGAAKPTQ